MPYTGELSLLKSCRRKISSTVLEGGLGVANGESFEVEGRGSTARTGVRGGSGEAALTPAWRRSISSTVDDAGRVGDWIGVDSPSNCSSPRGSRLVREVSTLALGRCVRVHLWLGDGPAVGGANIPLFELWDPVRLSDDVRSRRRA